jgi:hypothetical protein
MVVVSMLIFAPLRPRAFPSSCAGSEPIPSRACAGDGKMPNWRNYSTDVPHTTPPIGGQTIALMQIRQGSPVVERTASPSRDCRTAGHSR